MRIVHTVSSLQVGGMEQFVLRIVAAQRSQGHQVTVVALKDGPLSRIAREQGLPVQVLNAPHKTVRMARGLATLARLRPEIAHAHNPTSLHYAILGKLACGARVVMTDHGQGLGSVRHPSDREWGRTDAVVAVSDAVAQRRQIPALQGKVRVIRNGVEVTPAQRSRTAVRAELGIAEGQVVVTIVARLDGLKGHETLLRAMAHLRDGSEPAHPMRLLIAGDGAERRSLEALARELRLDDTSETEPVAAVFLGFRTDTPDLLAASDLFVLPSRTEGLPLSVLEAMAQRLPVISTPVGGVPEVVLPDKTGLFVPVDDPQALAEALREMARDEGKRHLLGEAGYERAITEFSFSRMVTRYESLYEELLKAVGGWQLAVPCRVPGGAPPRSGGLCRAQPHLSESRPASNPEAGECAAPGTRHAARAEGGPGAKRP